MKRIITSYIFILTAIVALAQGNQYIRVNRNDGGFNQLQRSEVDSIKWSFFDWNEGLSNTWKSQIIYTKDKQYIVPLAVTESIQFNMPYQSENKIYYNIQPMEEAGWDSLMILSNGYCSTLRSEENGFTKMAFGRMYAKDIDNVLVAQFAEDSKLVSLQTSESLVLFYNYRENKVDIIFNINGKIIKIDNVVTQNSSLHVNKRAGVSENKYFHYLNNLISYSFIVKQAIEGSTTGTGISILDETSSLSEKELENLPQKEALLSQSGIALETFLTKNISVMPVLSTLLNGVNYIEEKQNQRKKELYASFVGDSKIETLVPEKLDDNIYKIGVKVERTTTIPKNYLVENNVYGILLKKQPLSQPNYTLNLYDADAEIVYSSHLEKDEEVYINLPVEMGYKYVFCGFILTFAEKIDRDHGGLLSLFDSSNSFAYYGDKKEIVMGYSSIEDCRQVSAEYADGAIIFEADVDVAFSLDEIKDASEYGVTIYRKGVPVKDYPLESGINRGTVKIFFEADKENLTIEERSFMAKTQEFWTIAPYKKNKWGFTTEYTEWGVPLDLVYDKRPLANSLSTVYRGTTTAMVESEFEDFMFWDGVIAIQYWKEGENPIEKTLDVQWNGKQRIRLTGLEKESQYKYKAIIKRSDIIIAEGSTETFNTWDQMVKMIDFVQTGATYKEKAFVSNNIWYSYKYDVAVTFELVDALGVEDWGYNYIDLKGGVAKISLMGQKSPYTDTNYSYYRDEPQSWITYQPYVQFVDGTSYVMKRAIGYDNDEDYGFWYGDPIKCNITYEDSTPLVYSTGDATKITEGSATLTGIVENYNPSDESVQFAFFYSTSSDVMNATDGKSVVATYDSNGHLSAEITGLSDYTDYYYTLAIKRGDAAYEASEVNSFKTLPFVTTSEDVATTINSATLKGTCSKGIYVAGFAIKKDGESDYTQYSAWADSEGNFTATIDNLEINTKYVFYAFIQNDDVTYKGEGLSFSTKELHLCPDNNHPHMIDLGLPSGTKWACCNVGASMPEDYGEYYAWGETQTYNRDRPYAYSSSDNNYVYIGTDISGTEYDVAHVKWGEQYQMPNYEQGRELFGNCTSVWKSLNGVAGRIFTGPNGNTIFIPAGGVYWYDVFYAGKEAYYWTSKNIDDIPGTSWSINFDSNGGNVTNGVYRHSGMLIRPVQEVVKVTTGEAKNIKESSATLTGTVENYDPSDESVQFVFFYSTSSDVMNASDGKSVVATYDNNGHLTAEITGLSDYTDYYYTLAIKRSDAAYEASEVNSFKTLPFVTTSEDVATTINSATLKGTCSKGINVAGFAIKKDGESDYTQYSALADSEGNFTATIDNLEINAKYYFYAFIQNDDVTYKGEELSFSTKDIHLCPNNNHPHMIDLGLPSGTKWACCNVGASSPEEYGNYYAWGETQPKSAYEWENYQYWTENDGAINIGSDISRTNYDAATVNWGSPWHMPSLDQYRELTNNVTYLHWTSINGISGSMLVFSNGNSIFMPFAGYRIHGTHDSQGMVGNYWSSTLHTDIGWAWESDNGLSTSPSARYWGLSVRAVQ